MAEVLVKCSAHHHHPPARLWNRDAEGRIYNCPDCPASLLGILKKGPQVIAGREEDQHCEALMDDQSSPDKHCEGGGKWAGVAIPGYIEVRLFKRWPISLEGM